MKKLVFMIALMVTSIVSAQQTGDAPYVYQFGVNQVEKGSYANFKVTNSDANHMIMVLVGRYSREVVAHAFIASGESFMFKDLPTGPYSYRAEIDNVFYEDLSTTRLEGCNPKKYQCNDDYERSLEIWVVDDQRTGEANPNSKQITREEFFNKG